MGLDATSDRLELNTEKLDVTPALIPDEILPRLDWLRAHHFLPTPPEKVIINTHAELAAQITSPHVNLDLLSQHLSSLQTTRGEAARVEPPLITLDFYEINRTNLFTNRLRLYFQAGLLVSTRAIIADLQPRNPMPWLQGDFSANARSELIFLTRNDEDPENSLDSFFSRNQTIDVIILKLLKRINFGEELMWDHRRAQSQTQIDLTQTQSVLGMGPYIALCLQEVYIHPLSNPLTAKQATKQILPLLSDSSRLTRDYQVGSPQFKIELEAKGDDNQIIAADLAAKIFAPHGIFRKAGLSFALSLHRKVTI